VKRLRLRAIEGESFGDALPVEVFNHTFEVEPGRRVFFFAIRGEDAEALENKDSLRNLSQVLGDLAHPAQCVMYVIPKGLDLQIYEVEEEDDGAEKN